MRSNGFWLRSRSASWSVPALCLWLCIALLLLPSPIFAQNQTEQLNSIEQRLTAILASSQMLEDELENSKRISAEQQQHIGQLLSELEILRTRLEASRNRAGELLSTIEKLETRLKQLSESYKNTVKPLQQALTVAEKEIRRQKIKTVVYVILAAAAAGAVGYGIGKSGRFNNDY